MSCAPSRRKTRPIIGSKAIAGTGGAGPARSGLPAPVAYGTMLQCIKGNAKNLHSAQVSSLIHLGGFIGARFSSAAETENEALKVFKRYYILC